MNLDKLKELILDTWEKSAPNIVRFMFAAIVIEVTIVLMALPILLMLKVFS